MSNGYYVLLVVHSQPLHLFIHFKAAKVQADYTMKRILGAQT